MISKHSQLRVKMQIAIKWPGISFHQRNGLKLYYTLFTLISWSWHTDFWIRIDFYLGEMVNLTQRWIGKGAQLIRLTASNFQLNYTDFEVQCITKNSVLVKLRLAENLIFTCQEPSDMSKHSLSLYLYTIMATNTDKTSAQLSEKSLTLSHLQKPFHTCNRKKVDYILLITTKLQKSSRGNSGIPAYKRLNFEKNMRTHFDKIISSITWKISVQFWLPSKVWYA